MAGPRRTLGHRALTGRRKPRPAATYALPNAQRIDLLRADQYRQFSARPELLRDVAREALRSEKPVLVVDEVQKIPNLLDEAHALIAAHPQLRLVLTGSSARKLRRAGTNLLGGRATRVNLHPIVQCRQPPGLYGLPVFGLGNTHVRLSCANVDRSFTTPSDKGT